MRQLPAVTARTPQLIAASGARASYRFLEFFTAQIRNPHTRRAYARAAAEFFDWLAAKGVTRLAEIESVHVATYIEQLTRERSAPTAKLRLVSRFRSSYASVAWISSVRRQKRSMDARMSSADLVHRNGLGAAFRILM
jgi:site-specific recombinase XerD